MPQVLMNFDRYKGRWWVHFIESDCRTTIGTKTRFFTFPTIEDFRAFVLRCHPEDANLEDFDHSVRAWGVEAAFMSVSQTLSMLL
jgi:hypothetical protein